MAGEDSAVLEAIEKSSLLLVEGRDDQVFFLSLLGHLSQADSVAVERFGGKTALRGYLDALRIRDGYEKLQTLVVVRDADEDCSTALQSVCDALHAHQFACPSEPLALTDSMPRVAAIIMPCGEATGSLEDMCLRAVTDDPAMPCVRQYAECLDERAAETELSLCSSRAKLLVNAFLASRRNPSLKIGEAAKAGHWDFSHPVWQPLIDFINSM